MILNDLKARGVSEILITCVDGLSGFRDAIHVAFPNTRVQRCVLHKIRNSLKYVTYTEQNASICGLKLVYQAIPVMLPKLRYSSHPKDGALNRALSQKAER